MGFDAVRAKLGGATVPRDDFTGHMSDVPDGTIAYKFLNVERRLDRLESLEPAVMKQEIRDIKDDLRDIVKSLEGVNVRAMANDLTWVKRSLFAFVATFSITMITVAVVLINGGRP